MAQAALTVSATFIGLALGALLARRNEKRAHADRLLTEALNDLVAAVAAAAQNQPDAQARYGAATARIVLHGSSELVEAFRSFQQDATTATADGQRRLLAALQQARRELGRSQVDPEAAAVLLFGTRLVAPTGHT